MSDYDGIYGIALDAVQKTKKLIMLVSPDELDSASAGSIVALGIVAYKRWKVIGLGVLCVEASTAEHNPAIHFGAIADVDKYGTLTLTTTGAVDIHIGDYASRDARGYLATNSLQTGVAASWSDPGMGGKWDTWESTTQELQIKASVSASSGKWQAYALIEVDSEGAW